MADKSKGGRPKDSKSTKEQTMMPVTIEMTEMGGTRSGARAQTSERIEMTAAEIQVIKDRRIEEKAERERQAKAQRLKQAVEAVIQNTSISYTEAARY